MFRHSGIIDLTYYIELYGRWTIREKGVSHQRHSQDKSKADQTPRFPGP